MIDSWLKDIRYVLRMLAKSPGFTATAALSLAIGIGANATIFSIASALLMRPMPGLAEPSRLVDIGRSTRGEGFDTVSYPNFRDIRERTTRLSGVYAYEIEPRPMSLGGNGDAQRVYGALVSANYFDVLGTRPALGRLLQDADDERPEVAVISAELWERRFGADPDLVGRTIVLNGTPVTLAGIAPRAFQGTTVLKADVWVPVTAVESIRKNDTLLNSRRSVWLFMGGRLKDDATLPQAQAELTAIAGALEREYPEANKGRSLVVLPSAVVPGMSGALAGFIGLLMGIVGVILLIACVNLAGMLLARAAVRRREIAVRLAIGASRARLVRQLITETAVLFALAGALGLVLSGWLTTLLLSLIPQLPVPLALDLSIDWRVVLFGIVLSLAAALLSGLAPALHASSSDLVPALKSEGLEGAPHRLRLRNVFVVAQVTLSLVLVVGAVLLLRSVQASASADPGFDQTNVDVVSLDLSLADYQEAAGRRFVDDLLGRVRAMPGVESAAASVDLPLDGGRFGMGALRAPGVQLPDGRETINADWNLVSPGVFRTLRLPLVRGRDFTDADSTGAQPVAIVNEALVRRVWGDDPGLGRQLQMEGPAGDRTLTVVGVAGDAELITLGAAAEPYIYVPLSQVYFRRVKLVVRTTGASAIPHVRAIVRDLNPNLPVTDAMPLSEITAIGLVPQRIAAGVAGSLGLVGLLLAAIGIYGVTAYSVAQRTREIGIRIALGADARRVLGLVLRQGLVLAATGVMLGIVLAALGAQVLRSLLFGVQPLDPVAFGLACLVFAGVTLLATYIPARRATRVEATVALRRE